MNASEEGADLISIIVPNYNNAGNIECCLISIINQSYSNIEIVVIDDASVDESMRILENIKEINSNIILIKNEINLGVASSRNIGIKSAKGKYISTLDSDDYYLCIDKIKHEYELIKIKEAEGVDVISFSDIELVDVDGGHLTSMSENSPVKEGSITKRFSC